jgi:hypothetical protein
VSINEILYIIAYCIFLTGASMSFRQNGSRRSVGIMTCGVVIDFLVSMLPVMGVQLFKMEVQGTNAAIIFGIAFGFVVWLLFLAALVIRKRGNMSLYHTLITIIELAWFVDFISFLYGLYKFPLQGGH